MPGMQNYQNSNGYIAQNWSPNQNIQVMPAQFNPPNYNNM